VLGDSGGRISVSRRLNSYLKEKHHEHPGKTYQGSAGNASRGRGVAKHFAGLPQGGHLQGLNQCAKRR
jgi:hypothetical protein